MQEASSEELKKERKHTKKKEMNSSLEIASNSVSAGTDDAVMAKEKKRKKKREIEANDESVGGETPAEPEAEEESRSDKMKQRRETEVSNDSREGSAKPEAEESRKVKKKRVIEVSNSSGELPPGKGSRKDEKKRKREIRGEEDTIGNETAKEDNKSKKRKNEKDATEGAKEDKVDEVSSEPKKRAAKPRAKKSRKKVSFSDDNTKDDTVEFLVQGKRFTPEEDKLIKEAVFKYIEANLLGEEGLQMVLNGQKHRQIRNCWKEIGASLPWRPVFSVYHRAHILFERSEKRKWEPEEYEILQSFYKNHGADWKTLAKLLGKSKHQVRDTWRWLGMSNRKKGNWSQEEYQSLFDLVNLDLKLRANEEKKTMYGMLKDNICWGAISKKLTTRYDGACCLKWLQKLDACCVADVDWDNLLEHRSGEICRKRWDQMVRHIGGNREKSFVEQVDVLSKRYPTEMIEYREE